MFLYVDFGLSLRELAEWRQEQVDDYDDSNTKRLIEKLNLLLVQTPNYCHDFNID
jgi:hypothetical protein